MDKAHYIQHVSFSGTIMHLRVDGKDYQIDIASESERLRDATQKQRENFEISPAGYGIHWPDVDKDLFIKVKFLNRDDVLPRLTALAKQLLASRADVMEVSLFGSLARGNYAPGSDADIFILLKEDARRFTDRIPEFLTHFSGVGLPVEVFPYTIKEIMEMKEVGFIKNIQRGKIVLDERGRI